MPKRLLVTVIALGLIAVGIASPAQADPGERFIAPYSDGFSYTQNCDGGDFIFASCSVSGTGDPTTGAAASSARLHESAPFGTCADCQMIGSGGVVLNYQLQRRVRQLTVTAEIQVNSASVARDGTNTGFGYAEAVLVVSGGSDTCSLRSDGCGTGATFLSLARAETPGSSQEISNSLYEVEATLRPSAPAVDKYIAPGKIVIVVEGWSFLDKPVGSNNDLSATMDFIVRSITVR